MKLLHGSSYFMFGWGTKLLNLNFTKFNNNGVLVEMAKFNAHGPNCPTIYGMCRSFYKLLYCQSHSWRIPVQLAVVIYTLNCSSLVAHQAFFWSQCNLYNWNLEIGSETEQTACSACCSCANSVHAHVSEQCRTTLCTVTMYCNQVDVVNQARLFVVTICTCDDKK